MTLNRRRHTRHARAFKVTFVRANQKVVARGNDISEKGFSIEMSEREISNFMLFKGAGFKVRIDSSLNHYIVRRAVVRNVIKRPGQTLLLVGFEITEIDVTSEQKHKKLIEGKPASLNPSKDDALITMKANLELHKASQKPSSVEFNLLNQESWPAKVTGQAGNLSEYVCTDKGIARMDFTQMHWILTNTNEAIDATEVHRWTTKI